MELIKKQQNRREFMAGAISVTAALAMPNLLLANKNPKQIIIGDGEYQYEVQHNFVQLPDKYKWQTTHNVAIDAEGLIYVIHEGRENLKDHPSIFVFDNKGKFVRAFGSQFQGGGHGLEVRKEGNEQYLYVCAYQNVKAFAKLTLKGETIWEKYAPMDSGVYRINEDKKRIKRWGRDAFLPTNFAFLNDGGFLLADGYGAWCIHRFDKAGNWVSKFGEPGNGNGTFNTPHGLWIDRRSEGEEKIVVCDRGHHTLQIFTLNGKYINTLKGYGLPANIDTHKNIMLIPELHARLTLLDDGNKVIARLGDDVEGVVKQKNVNRGKPETWVNGKFVHPHDACFDENGNIIVAEWVSTGRVSRLKKVS